jgi:hypothetical protein
MNIRKWAVVILCWPTVALAQDFDEQGFVRALNEALRNQGISATVGGETRSAIETIKGKSPELQLAVPDYGVAVKTPDGQIASVFGPTAPVSRDAVGKIVGIDGYFGGPGVSYEVIGSDQYVAQIAGIASAAELDPSITRAVEVFRAATELIVSRLCESKGRPSEITLNLDANFNLVIGVSTGTEAKWDLTETCSRQ